MNRIILTAESGSDITQEQAVHYGIEIVPMHVTLGDETLDDGTFPTEHICDFYKKTGQLPKTSGSMPEDFSRTFDRIHDRWPDAQILHLAYSAVTTVSFSCARMAASERNYVTVFDTKHVSAGQQAVVIQTAEWLECHPNASLDEVVRFVENLCAQTKMCFLPANLEYLRAGGRCSNAACLGGKLLQLHPLIEIQNGKLVAEKKYRGSFSRVIPQLVQEYTTKNELRKDRLWLICSVGLTNDIKLLAEKTARDQGYKNLSWVQTGCVITTHGGPGCFGIVGVTGQEARSSI